MSHLTATSLKRPGRYRSLRWPPTKKNGVRRADPSRGNPCGFPYRDAPAQIKERDTRRGAGCRGVPLAPPSKQECCTQRKASRLRQGVRARPSEVAEKVSSGDDKCQGPASAGPQNSQKNSFLAPQARAQRSGATQEWSSRIRLLFVGGGILDCFGQLGMIPRHNLNVVLCNRGG
jgi:hypothetical protein